MLNFSLALPIQLRQKWGKAKSSKDPSKAALMSRRVIVQLTAAEFMDFWRRGLVHLEKL